MRTLSASQDIDGRIADGLEGLVQRVTQRLRFWVGTWFLNRNQGVHYRMDIFGQRQFLGIAQQAITDQILSFTGEVTGVDDVVVSLDNASRTLTYEATVSTVYGSMSITGELA